MYPRVQLTPPEPYAVYVLECTVGDADKVIRRAFDKYAQPPWWLDPALTAPVRYYVGSTGDIVTRLVNHIDQDTDAADFTTIFRPIELKEVEWHQSYRKAADREGEREIELKREFPEYFVWSN